MTYTRKRNLIDDPEDQLGQKHQSTEEVPTIMSSNTKELPAVDSIIIPKEAWEQLMTTMANQAQTTANQAQATANMMREIRSDIQAQTTVIQTGMTELKTTCEKQRKLIEVIQKKVETLETARTSQEEVIKSLRRENEFLKKKTRENNLIVYGLKEKQNETPADLQRSIEGKLKDGAGITNLSVDFVHRLGKPKLGKTRAVKLRLVKLSDKSKILKAKKQISEIKFHEDLPPETLKTYKTIEALVNLARKQGRVATHRGCYAVIDDERVEYDEALKIIGKPPETSTWN